MKNAFLLVFGAPIVIAIAFDTVNQLALAKRVPCPATQPGLILRDLEHQPIARLTYDREYIVLIDGERVLDPGINRSEAEALAVQLGRAFPGVTFTARPQIGLEPAK
jgi:hypothetical protein